MLEQGLTMFGFGLVIGFIAGIIYMNAINNGGTLA